MPLVSRKGLLAIAAVVDVALRASVRPVSGKALAARHGLSPRHLEPVLQALVRNRILRGIRGSQGGYELARDQHALTAEDILIAARSPEEDGKSTFASDLVKTVVRPALKEAEQTFLIALRKVSVADMVKLAHRKA